MTELLIGAVSWLATLGFIVAAIAEAFRWPLRRPPGLSYALARRSRGVGPPLTSRPPLPRAAL